MRKAVEDRLEKKSDRNLMGKKFQTLRLITIEVNHAAVVSTYVVAFSMSVWAWQMLFPMSTVGNLSKIISKCR